MRNNQLLHEAYEEGYQQALNEQTMAPPSMGVSDIGNIPKGREPLSIERGKESDHDYGTERMGGRVSPCPPAHPACKPGDLWPDPPPIAHHMYWRVWGWYHEEANRVGEGYDWGQFGLFTSCGTGCWTVGPFYFGDGQQYNFVLRWSGPGDGLGQHGSGPGMGSARGYWAWETELTGETCITCYDAWRGTHW